MEKIQLIHPEGKKAPRMDKAKYDALSSSFLGCLKKRKTAPFHELQADVENDLTKRNISVEGKLEWNLFWVTLDLESRREIRKDRSVSPIRYSLP